MMSSAFPKHLIVAFRSGKGLIAGYDADAKFIYSVRYEFLLFLSKFLNFTFKIVAPPDGSFGRRSEDGNWTGVRGILQRGQADISFEPFSFITEQQMDYSFPVIYDRITFLTQKPQPSQKYLTFFQPFSWTVGISLIILTVGLSLLFCSINGNGRQCVRTFFSTLGTIIGQPFSVPLTTKSQVFLIAGWIIAISFLILSFKATFLSFLLANPTKRISTIGELALAVTDGSVKCRTYKGHPIINGKLMELGGEYHRIIHKSVTENSKENDIASSYFDAHSIEKTCFISHDRDLLQKNYDMLVSKDSFFYIMLTFPMRKKFRGRKILNKALERMFETGLVEKIRNDYHFKIKLKYEKPPLEKHLAGSEERLALKDFQMVFAIVIGGLGLAFFVFLGEMVCFYFAKSLKLKNENKLKIIKNPQNIEMDVKLSNESIKHDA